VKKSFNIQELLHRKSKRHETRPMHPASLKAFQRDQECDLKHPGSVNLIRINKTNKLPSFIDRCYVVSLDCTNSAHIFFHKVTRKLQDPTHDWHDQICKCTVLLIITHMLHVDFCNSNVGPSVAVLHRISLPWAQ
jgi:hypothetical protein